MSAGVRTLSTVALLVWLAAIPAAAQDVSLPTAAAPPANLAFVEGGVDLIHEGVADRAVAGTMLTDGDLVRTLNGRAEIVFADGTLLHLDYSTELELLSPVRLRLSAGRVSLRVSPSATPYVIDTQAASVRLDPRGEYGLTVDGRLSRLELTVARGGAEIDDGAVRTLVRGGEAASILGAGGRALVQQFNSARWDAFERWANERANGFSIAASARQLPYELRPYGETLDNYGRWDYIAPYGNVWFPAVAASWRPYYTGEWRRTRYGWTWIGHDPWSWPTHHYGRWGFTGASWYWIPARVWGPAWVSWSFSPGFVSWCPLGFDGRAVIGYSNVSLWLRGGRDHPDYRPHYDPWRAWTVMPRDHFDHRRPVRTHAIDPTRLPDDTRRAMVNTAVPRNSVAPPSASARSERPASYGETSPKRSPNDVREGGLPAADTRVPTRAFQEPRGAVRSPNAIPAPSAPRAPRAPDAPSAPDAPRYERSGAVERRGETRQDDRADTPASARPQSATSYGETSPKRQASEGREGGPRVYTPPTYAVPRSEPRREREERAEAPPPQRREPSRRTDDAPASGGRVRSPSAAPRESGEGRSAAPPARRSGGSEGQSQGNSGGGGGAVRRRP